MATLFSDEYFMQQALFLAQEAFEVGEVPIGAVIVSQNRIIGKGYNQTERLMDPTAHAEMLAITAACNYLGSKYLQDCTLYVTIEPCPMCAGALRWSQISQLVFAAPEPKTGFRRHQPDILHPQTTWQDGILAQESKALMQQFFANKRA